MRAILLFVLASVVLAGCSHRQPSHVTACAFIAYPLNVGDTRQATGREFEAVLARAMTPPPPDKAANTPPPSILVLSGGSQHGAFGAGFFAGLPQIPDYKMVTGVSTGALQSTFLFLANSPVPPDRRYAAYMPQQPGQKRSNAGDLAAAYSISKEGDLLDVGDFGEVGGVIRGSIGNFRPLRSVLSGLLSEQTLKAVGQSYDHDPQLGRRLLVGVTDTVDGNGYAIDLTELAHRLVAGTQDFSTVQGCYIDALIASSSVPLAVAPVTLDMRVDPTSALTTRHMYVDGGARFGVFYKQIDEIMRGSGAPDVTLIVNGFLYGGPWLDKNGLPQTKWSAISLGLRSVDILENQVYRFSVENIQRLGQVNGRIKFAFISSQGLPPQWPAPEQYVWNGKSCTDWSAIDSQAGVTEFHPNYMKCIVAYGHERGEAKAWNTP
jgi:predicted acylesterase/phospholipase RssA